MKRLEAICDAVAQYHNYHEPESDAYALRNPGMLHEKGNGAKRAFSCHKAGYAALLEFVRQQSIAYPDQNMGWLLGTLGIKMKLQQENTLDFASRCANGTVKLETSLRWFIENA